MKVFRIILATVLSIFMMVQAVAKAEVGSQSRILTKTAFDDAQWSAYLDILSKRNLQIGDKAFSGYDPKSGLVYVGGVVVRACEIAEGKEWEEACSNPEAMAKSFIETNKVPAFILQADLRARAKMGLFVRFAPFKVATTGATTFPVVSSGEPAASAAPTAATVQQPAAVQSTASASTPTVIVKSLTEDDVKRIASEAANSVNSQAAATLNGQLAIQDKAIANLREQIAKASSAEMVGDLNRRLKELSGQRDADAKALKDAQEGLKETKASLDTEVAKLPATAAAAAASAVQPLVAGIKRGNEQFKTDIGNRVNAIEGQVKTGSKWGVTTMVVAVLAGLIAIAGIGFTVMSHRSARLSAKKTEFELGEMKKGVKASVDTINKELDGYEKVNQRLDGEMKAVQTDVHKVGLRLNDAETRVSSLEAGAKKFGFDDAQVISNARAMFGGTKEVIDFTVDGDQFQIEVEKADGDYVIVRGIKDQTEPLKIANLPGRIKRAANKGHLVGLVDIDVDPPASLTLVTPTAAVA